MDTEHLRSYLRQYVHESGTVGDLKARLKSTLMTKLLTQQVPPIRPSLSLKLRALNVFVLHHLSSLGFECTQNVFQAELGTGPTLTDRDAIEALYLGPSCATETVSTTSAPHTLEDVIDVLHKASKLSAHREDAAIQATPDSSNMTIEEKLSACDREMALRVGQSALLSDKGQEWESRLRKRQEEAEAMLRADIKAENDLWRRRELETARAEEARKHRAIAQDKLQEYAELEQQLRHTVQMERFELQQRKREVEAQAAAVEAERTKLSTVVSDRERSCGMLSKDLMETRDRLREATAKCTALQEQLTDIQAALEVGQRRLLDREVEVRNLTDTMRRMEETHRCEVDQCRRVVAQQREDLALRSSDIEHRLHAEQLRYQQDYAALKERFESQERQLMEKDARLKEREAAVGRTAQDLIRGVAAYQKSLKVSQAAHYAHTVQTETPQHSGASSPQPVPTHGPDVHYVPPSGGGRHHDANAKILPLAMHQAREPASRVTHSDAPRLADPTLLDESHARLDVERMERLDRTHLATAYRDTAHRVLVSSVIISEGTARRTVEKDESVERLENVAGEHRRLQVSNLVTKEQDRRLYIRDFEENDRKDIEAEERKRPEASDLLAELVRLQQKVKAQVSQPPSTAVPPTAPQAIYPQSHPTIGFGEDTFHHSSTGSDTSDVDITRGKGKADDYDDF